MKFHRRKFGIEGIFCLLAHFHDLDISAAVLQIVGWGIDHGLPEAVDGCIVNFIVGTDKFGSPLFGPAVIIDPDIHQTVDAEGKRTRESLIFSDSVRESVVQGAGIVFHVGRPAFIRTGTAEKGEQRNGGVGSVVYSLIEMSGKSFMRQSCIQTGCGVFITIINVNDILVRIVQRRSQIECRA